MRMSEVSSIDIDELRHLMGDRRGKLRLGVAHWDFADQKRDTVISTLALYPSADEESNESERSQISVA